MGDLQALSVAPSYLDFAPGLAKAFLYPRAGYTPKVPTTAPRPVVLQAFHPPPFRDSDQAKLNCMCPVRALDTYVHRATQWRRSDQLLVCVGPPRRGLPASKHTIGRWIVETITACYESSGPPRLWGSRHTPLEVWAALQGLFCRCPCFGHLQRCGWSTPSTFVRRPRHRYYPRFFGSLVLVVYVETYTQGRDL